MSDESLTSEEHRAFEKAWVQWLEAYPDPANRFVSKAFEKAWFASRDWQRAQAQPAATDEVTAAAERLLDNAYRLGIDDQRAQDIQTVASYALEAGQEAARLRAAFQAIRSHRNRMHIKPYLKTNDVHHLLHIIDAALSTPGEPESEG